jgi:DNA-binding CsgD family transcriptional regulator
MITMKNQIDHHPSIVHAADLAKICEPLLNLNISYFSHVNIDQSGKFSSISNSPGLERHYLEKKYYNVDIHMAKIEQLPNYYIWDAIELCGDSSRMYHEAGEFGAQHVFTIIDQQKDEHNYFHFATNLMGETINQIYMSNLDLLQLFIMYFKDSVHQSKQLSQAYDFKFSIDDNAKGYSTNEGADKALLNLAHLRKSFLKEFRTRNKINAYQISGISHRELEILWWLHQGKTVDDIAAILGSASITINRQIAQIKKKTQCYTQFQLGEFFANFSK